MSKNSEICVTNPGQGDSEKLENAGNFSKIKNPAVIFLLFPENFPVCLIILASTLDVFLDRKTLAFIPPSLKDDQFSRSSEIGVPNQDREQGCPEPGQGAGLSRTRTGSRAVWNVARFFGH
jgi:hypothetical protein